MRPTAPIGGTCVAVCLALVTSAAPAAAAPKRITGKLSRPRYTVIALAGNGKATSVKATKGKFKLRPPAKKVTLHLRAPNGTYAGPIVVGGKGKRAIVGVKAGARLGKIKVHKGYAKVKRKPPKKSVDAKRKARAAKGVPIGAGNFGRVRSKRTHGGAPGDLDLDGIPNVIDVDDDGDLILDDLDRSTAARSSQAAPGFGLHSVLGLPPEAVLNANAAAVTDSEIDTTFQTASGSYLIIGGLAAGAELDCGGAIQQPPRQEGLRYCSPGGTGRAFKGDGNRSGWPRFPDDFDPDHNGFGTPPQGATTAEIRTGDVVIERIGGGDTPTEVPATLQYMFATVPALVAYRDTAGNSRSIPYPVSPGDPGTNSNGLPAGAPAGGDVVLTLTFWRPQRRPIPPETGDWVDIGGLTYKSIVQHVGAPPGGTEVAKSCPQSTLSSTDLSPPPGPFPGGSALVDPAPDRPASPANTFTYTLNLSECLRQLGVSWNSGETLGLTGEAVSANGGGDAEETVVFKRE